MLISTRSMVTMSEANRNFSKIARLVEQEGAVVIMKNNKPHFVLMPFQDDPEPVHEAAAQNTDAEIMQFTEQFADQYAQALAELAK